jgi:hypothetical protein
MTTEQKLDYIAAKVSRTSRLMQVAEEAAELIHAATKLARIKAGDNPAAVSRKQALKNLVEEIADVKNSIDALQLDDILPSGAVEEVERVKLDRWFERVKLAGKNEYGSKRSITE